MLVKSWFVLLQAIRERLAFLLTSGGFLPSQRSCNYWGGGTTANSFSGNLGISYPLNCTLLNTTKTTTPEENNKRNECHVFRRRSRCSAAIIQNSTRTPQTHGRDLRKEISKRNYPGCAILNISNLGLVLYSPIKSLGRFGEVVRSFRRSV